MKIERQISWGNLIGLIPLVFVAMFWLADRQSDGKSIQMNRQTIELHAVAQANQATMLARHGERLSALERQADRDRREIMEALARIENRMDRR